MDPNQKRIMRRVGFAGFGVITLCLCVPMLLGAIRGLETQRIWDPYTGKMLTESNSDETACRSQAEQLIRAAGRMTRREPSWEEQVRVWTVKCRKDHPEAYQMLTSTRRHIGTPIEESPE